jgi:hypothetical protein
VPGLLSTSAAAGPEMAATLIHTPTRFHGLPHPNPDQLVDRHDAPATSRVRPTTPTKPLSDTQRLSRDGVESMLLQGVGPDRAERFGRELVARGSHVLVGQLATCVKRIDKMLSLGLGDAEVVEEVRHAGA